MSVLDDIVKAYDIRGTVPDQFSDEVARALEKDEAPVLSALQALTGGELVVHADALLHQEQFDLVAV